MSAIAMVTCFSLKIECFAFKPRAITRHDDSSNTAPSTGNACTPIKVSGKNKSTLWLSDRMAVCIYINCQNDINGLGNLH